MECICIPKVDQCYGEKTWKPNLPDLTISMLPQGWILLRTVPFKRVGSCGIILKQDLSSSNPSLEFQCHEWGWNPSLLQPAWTKLGSRLISHCQSVPQHPPSLHPELVRWYLSGLMVHLVDSKTAQRDRIILAVSCVHGDASQLLTSKMHLNQL